MYKFKVYKLVEFQSSNCLISFDLKISLFAQGALQFGRRLWRKWRMMEMEARHPKLINKMCSKHSWLVVWNMNG